jgi:heparosan-N-sulfate-glucuronate 5-epimerase
VSASQEHRRPTPRRAAARTQAGPLSSARSFFLPLGERFSAERVEGFPIDMRIKAPVAAWPPATASFGPQSLHVPVIQYGLGAYEHWLADGGEEWLAMALRTGEHLLATQDRSGAWLHRRDFWHTFPVRAPWASAISQGEAASLLVRLHLQTGEQRFAEAALAALGPLRVAVADGGVASELGGRIWLEEYPCTPPSHVLNGAIFALWGLRDVAVGLGDERARLEFEAGVDSLAHNLARYDTGHWSLYSLFPHPLANLASSFYHDLHVSMLAAMERLAPRPEFSLARERWAAYARSPRCRRRATLHKVAFRLLVPRNRLLARRMPWTRL